MSDILCVTNRGLCKESFLVRIAKIAAAHPAGIILREKDLEEKKYRELAGEVMEICKKQDTLCILHSFPGVAMDLNCTALHLPLPVLRSLSNQDKSRFTILGASCHSLEDAMEAERLGCTYITAGHVFDTDCKRGLPGRGLHFLKEICESISIPVYAIGGICADNVTDVRKSGAAGACVMSSAMVCDEVEKYFLTFEENGNGF